MDQITLKSRWPQWRVALQERFEKLEASDLAAIGGEVSLLVESLQHRYGWDRERAEIEVAAALESPPPGTTTLPLADLVYAELRRRRVVA